MTDAHYQKETEHLLFYYPEHSPRKSDPYYHIFEETRRRMKEQGLLKCAVCGTDKSVELHHDKVEFAMQNGVDLDKFNEIYSLHLKNDDAFKQYIEGPGNLEPLCTDHHRGHLGIHHLDTPSWSALRVWKDELPPPAQVDDGKQ